MRTLPKELQYIPRIMLLRFSHFFVFVGIAALLRLFIDDNIKALFAIVSIYCIFLSWEKLLPPKWLYYTIARVKYFKRLKRNQQ